MTEELGLPCPYKIALDRSSNTYTFTTDNGSEYHVLFQLDNSLFLDTAIQDSDVYHIILIKNSKGIGIEDDRVAEAIDTIVSHFFEDRNRILLYSCDANDGKHQARMRLFNYWYAKSQMNMEIAKMDAEIDSLEYGIYYSSMLFHKDNVLGALKISASFEYIVQILKEGKN